MADVPIGFFLNLQLSEPFGHRPNELGEDGFLASRTFVIDVEG